MAGLSKDNLLRSWKEIASYLGCDVRTCHRWEAKHRMPVHRAEGSGSRSPVFAYKDELDAWFQETFKNASPPEERRRSGRAWLKWAGAGAAVLALAAAAIFLLRGSRDPRQPADFTIDGSFLVILDKGKRELWREDTGYEDLMPESFFRARFQAMTNRIYDAFPSLVIKDIDGDGDTEVLFTPKRSWDDTGLGSLYCYDREGKRIWSFEADRELKCGDRVFSPDYRIRGFVCHDLDGDGRLETLVIAHHRPDWPCQLAVLDSSGRMVGEYWNSGQLASLAFHDITGDGREEIIAAGINNEYRGGCLIVFDALRISGASPQSGKFACEGLGPGSELYYVTVPFADVSAAQGHAVVGIVSVFITGNDRISAAYDPSLYYEFDFGLACTQSYTGHGYELAHEEMVKAGKIMSVLDAAYLRKMREDIRYWTGSEWTAEPSPVKR